MDINWKKASKIAAVVIPILGALGGGGYTVVDQSATARADIKHVSKKANSNEKEIDTNRADIADMKSKINYIYCYLRAQESGGKVDIDCLLDKKGK